MGKLIARIKMALGVGKKSAAMEIEIKKQALKIQTLEDMIKVYERAINNERSVSTKCLKQLEEVLKKDERNNKQQVTESVQ